MFSTFNEFGSMFKASAQYISLLIRKNMVLNSKVAELEDELQLVRSKIKNEYEQS